MEEFDARIGFGIVAGNLIRIVGGAVVNDDNFEILISLAEDRIEAGGEIFFSVIYWNDDGNERVSLGHVWWAPF